MVHSSLPEYFFWSVVKVSAPSTQLSEFNTDHWQDQTGTTNKSDPSVLCRPYVSSGSCLGSSSPSLCRRHAIECPIARRAPSNLSAARRRIFRFVPPSSELGASGLHIHITLFRIRCLRNIFFHDLMTPVAGLIIEPFPRVVPSGRVVQN
jgi:hypothetical protein